MKHTQMLVWVRQHWWLTIYKKLKIEKSEQIENKLSEIEIYILKFYNLHSPKLNLKF
jgi:hypothetical protein